MEAEIVPERTEEAPLAPTRNSRLFEILIVLTLCVLSVASQIRWSHLYHDAPQADFAMHVADAAAFASVLDAPGHVAEKGISIWAWPDLYGGGVYLTSYLLRPITGASVAALLDSLALYLCLTVLGAYLLGRAAGGPAVGATAATLSICDPRFLGAARHYWLDMPLTGMILVTLAALVGSEGFRRRTPGVLAGVLLGLTLQVKYTGVWFLVAPFLAAFGWGLWRERPPVRDVVGFAAAAGVAGMVVLWLSSISLQRQMYMLEADSIAPPLSFQLVFACAATALIWATFAWYRLPGMLATSTLAAAAALGIAGPWGLVNRFVIGERWSAVAGQMPGVIAQWRENVQLTLQFIPVWVVVAGALGVVVALASRRKRPAMGLVLLALACGYYSTLTVLGAADRYLVPSTVLLTILGTGIIPRTPWIAWPIFGVSLVVPAILLFGQPIGTDLAGDQLITSRFSATVANLRSPDVDREPLARTLSTAMGDARSVSIVATVDSDRMRDDMFGLYYLLVASENWSGHPRSITLLVGTPPTVQPMDLLPLQPVRVRTLEAWRGAPTTPSSGRSALPPDAVVMPNGVLDPVQAAREMFGRVYTQVPLDTTDVVLLKATATR